MTRARDGARIASRAGRWQVMARVDHPHPAAAECAGVGGSRGGANGLALVGADLIGARGFGVAPALDTIEPMLAGVHLDAGITIEFEFGPQSKDAAARVCSAAGPARP